MITDGLVTLRPPAPDDRATLVSARDEPTFCIVVGGRVVGWVDHRLGQVSYAVDPDAQGRDLSTRVVNLMLHHLAVRSELKTATIVDERAPRVGERPVPPLRYTDGVVTIRRIEVDDLDLDLEARDDVQLHWLWEPAQRETWAAMSAGELRDDARRRLEGRRDAFGSGPKWSFAADVVEAPYVARVDCDLANRQVPHGEANIGYFAHPAHRGKGYVSRAVRLALQFLREHTGASEAHIGMDVRNEASLRVALAVGAVEVRRSVDEAGRTGVHHVIRLRD